MALKERGKILAAGLLAGALIGGGLAAMTPAGAAVKQAAAAATDWKAIWKTEIKPRADKRYYTKKLSNARYYTKAQADAAYETKAAHDASLAGYYTKAQSDANYYTKAQSDLNYYTKAQSDANYYTKAASDAKYAPAQPLYRGSLMLGGMAAAANSSFTGGISFGATFSAPPTVHYVKLGDLIPIGCSGGASAPNAAAGNLCIFETEAVNVTSRSTCRSGGNACGSVADAFGAGVFAYSTAAGATEVLATWAARPLAVANPALTGSSGGTNGTASSAGPASAR